MLAITSFLTILFITIGLYGSDEVLLKRKFSEVDQKIYHIINNKSEADLTSLIKERETLCAQSESMCIDLSKWIDNILAYNAKPLLDRNSQLIFSVTQFAKNNSIVLIYQQIINAIGGKMTPTKELMIVHLLSKEYQDHYHARETLLKWYIQTQQKNIKLLALSNTNNQKALRETTKNYLSMLDKLKQQKPINYDLLEYAYSISWKSIVDENLLSLYKRNLKLLINEIFFLNIKYKYLVGRRSQIITLYEKFLRTKKIQLNSLQRNDALEYTCTSYRYTAQDKKCIDLLNLEGLKKLSHTLKIEHALTLYKMGLIEDAYNSLEKIKADKSMAQAIPWANYYLSHILYSKKEYNKAEEHLKLFMSHTSIQYPLKPVTEAIILIKIYAQQKRFSEAHEVFKKATDQIKQEVRGSFYDSHILNFSYLFLLIKKNNLNELQQFVTQISSLPFIDDRTLDFYKLTLQITQNTISKQNIDALITQLFDCRGKSNPETNDFLEAIKTLH